METPAEALDVELESSAGGARRLRELRGRVVVLFWEDRDHQLENAALKGELGRLAGDAALARAVSVVAIGDVSAFDFAPARAIVRAAIRVIAPLAGIEIWLDWSGALARPPFSLAVGKSNVMVIDREGRASLRRSGPLGADGRAEVLDAVRAQLVAHVSAA